MKRSYTPEFEEFWRAYPSQNGKWQALIEWRKLSTEDRNQALACLPKFREWIAKQPKDYRVVWACRYLKYRRFEDFQSDGGGVKLNTWVEVIPDTPEYQAWWDFLGQKPPPSKWAKHDGAALFSSRWPPGHPNYNQAGAVALETPGLPRPGPAGKD
jgi:hypothetical protein